MRIVAGALRGRPLGRPPKGVRPTSDKVREALFDVVGPVDGFHVLDLFAGTGALGLEALSRGAARAVFVDESAASTRAVAENAAKLGMELRARVLRLPAARALRTLASEGIAFDLVLVDPPYGRDLAGPVLEDLVRLNLCAPDARIAVEIATRDRPPAPTGLSASRPRRYGDTTLVFYRPSPEAEVRV
jgi:16S rRNA (guanine966-N2)-methyltransferase